MYPPKMVPVPMAEGDTLRRWQLIETWVLELLGHGTYSIPRWFVFDGASIPRVFRNIYSPTGYLLYAALVHDYAYKYGCVYFQDSDGNNGKIFLTRKKADQIFKDIANIVYPFHKWKTQFAYRALRIGGWVPWSRYREKGNVNP